MTVPHTPGTLAFNESEYEPNRFTIGVDGKWLMSIQHNGEQLVEVQRANMQRLVDCWNASLGVTDEMLEAFEVDLDRIVQTSTEIARQRDALLDTLKGLQGRLLRSIKAGASASEAYDSFYQQDVDDAITQTTRATS